MAKVERNWNQVVVDAIMHRAGPPEAGTPTIVIRRQVFDELVSIAELATRANGVPAANISASHENGQWTVTISTAVLAPCSAKAVGIVEALGNAAREWSLAVDRSFR